MAGRTVVGPDPEHASLPPAVTVWVEPPDGWGARQLLATELRALGYTVEMIGAGEDWRLLLS